LPPGASLKAVSETIRKKCITCDLCRNECAFLKKYGSPDKIAAFYDPLRPDHLKLPFECSLCGLCAAVCPVDINPADMFLEMRREAVDRGYAHFGAGCISIGYERRGTSKHLSYYALPDGCDTIFFPGCTFPATRHEETLKLFALLQEKYPYLGVVLDCCTKPSHDLGRQAFFHAMFSEMRDFLVQNGVRNVIVTCPNCYKIFSRYGESLKAETVYEILNDNGFAPGRDTGQTITLQDPCVLRFEPSIQQSIRKMIQQMGFDIVEMPHSGAQTLCCGEGGSVGCVAPELADMWKDLRIREAGDRKIVTYCAGCANRLGAQHPTFHILDLFLNMDPIGTGGPVQPRFPLTCLNRLKLKNHLKSAVDAAVVRERIFQADPPDGRRTIRNTIAFTISLIISKILLLRK
jgi:Fe-S oxidoreductase